MTGDRDPLIGQLDGRVFHLLTWNKHERDLLMETSLTVTVTTSDDRSVVAVDVLLDGQHAQGMTVEAVDLPVLRRWVRSLGLPPDSVADVFRQLEVAEAQWVDRAKSRSIAAARQAIARCPADEAGSSESLVAWGVLVFGIAIVVSLIVPLMVTWWVGR